jgi:hypothetical protein
LLAARLEVPIAASYPLAQAAKAHARLPSVTFSARSCCACATGSHGTVAGETPRTATRCGRALTSELNAREGSSERERVPACHGPSEAAVIENATSTVVTQYSANTSSV